MGLSVGMFCHLKMMTHTKVGLVLLLRSNIVKCCRKSVEIPAAQNKSNTLPLPRPEFGP